MHLHLLKCISTQVCVVQYMPLFWCCIVVHTNHKSSILTWNYHTFFKRQKQCTAAPLNSMYHTNAQSNSTEWHPFSHRLIRQVWLQGCGQVMEGWCFGWRLSGVASLCGGGHLEDDRWESSVEKRIQTEWWFDLCLYRDLMSTSGLVPYCIAVLMNI